MAPKPSSKELRLPDLSIKGFRGIKDLSISRLGRVTLFTGENGVGKTTLLDAIRVYAARGHYQILNDILRDREELSSYMDEDDDEILGPDWNALFYRRRESSDALISVGPTNKSARLSIGISPVSTRQLGLFAPDDFSSDELQALNIVFRNYEQEIPLRYLSSKRYGLLQRRSIEPDYPHAIRSESLGPGLLNNGDMARFWEKVALTDDENKAVQALNFIFGNRVERITVIGGTRSSGPRAVIRIKGEESPIPLKSLGDGAVRLFGVALALANSKGGFLLIDEAENGIHHSVQHDFWKMILQTAQKNNVQVFATTHSWDCVPGFAQAASDLDEVDGALVRIEKLGERIRAVEYSEEDLVVIAEQGIEVR